MNRILCGDALTELKTLDSDSVQCCITSPPYWGLRDYGVDGQLGLEKSPEEYIAGMTAVFMEVFRVLRPDGTLWLNIGDSYFGNASSGGDGLSVRYTGKRVLPKKESSILKAKDLVGIPWRLAFSLQSAGWYLRQDIIWHKPNPMPESVTDRCTKAHEYVFLMSKSGTYKFNQIKEDSITDEGREHGIVRDRLFDYDSKARAMRTMPDSHKNKQGSMNDTKLGLAEARQRLKEGAYILRNARSVWTIPTEPSSIPHFAIMPSALAKRCLVAGTDEGDVVLDPFCGTGTTCIVAKNAGRKYIGIDLDPRSCKIAEQRLAQEQLI